MKLHNICLVILLLISVPPARAGVLEYQSYGSWTGSYSAATSVMGLRGVAMPGESPLANPALGALKTGLTATFSLNADWKREVRSREVFDSYSNSVGMNTESVNLNGYVYPSVMSVNYAFNAFGNSEHESPVISFSLAAASECDYTYDYKKEVRDVFFMLTETDLVESRGRIAGYTGGAAARLLPFLSFGLSGTVLAGSHTIEYSRLYEDPAAADSVTTFSEDVTGTRLNAGLWAGVGNRLALAAVYNSSRDFKGDNPDQLVLGINYSPASIIPASLAVEYGHFFWDKASRPLNDSLELYGVNTYSLGITHKIKYRLPLSFGVSFANSYFNSGIGFAQAGLGTELSFRRFNTQVGFTLGRRSFNLGQALGTSDPVTVSELETRLMLTFVLK
jgi:hypothetical protein